MQFIKWAGPVFLAMLLGGAFAAGQTGGPGALPLYICGDNAQDLAELQTWGGGGAGGGDVKFMQFIDREPSGASGGVWPSRITQAYIDRLVSKTPNRVAIMLDREDALYTTMMNAAGEEQETAERWFDRMQDRVATARPGAPLVGWYVGLNYIDPCEQYRNWWSGASPTDTWAAYAYRVGRLRELLSDERNALYVCIYAPADDATHTLANAKIGLAPFLELAKDCPGKVYAVIGDRLYNGRPDNNTPEVSDAAIRAQIQGAEAARGFSDSGEAGGARRIDGIVYWHADMYYRQFLEPSATPSQRLVNSKARLGRTIRIMREECGYIPPAPPPPVVIAPPPPPPPATQPVTMLESGPTRRGLWMPACAGMTRPTPGLTSAARKTRIARSAGQEAVLK